MRLQYTRTNGVRDGAHYNLFVNTDTCQAIARGSVVRLSRTMRIVTFATRLYLAALQFICLLWWQTVL